MRYRPILLGTTVLSSVALAGTLMALAPQTKSTSTPPPTTTYTIDSVHSCVLFRIQHMGAGQFYGRFNTINGSFNFTEGTDTDLGFSFTIPVDSVDTGAEKRDAHLKSPDFFNAREFPTILYHTEDVRKVRDGLYKTRGEHTIKNVTKSVNGMIEWTGSADKGMGYRCGMEAKVTLKRSDFGVDYMLEDNKVGDEVQIIASFEGVRK